MYRFYVLNTKCYHIFSHVFFGTMKESKGKKLEKLTNQGVTEYYTAIQCIMYRAAIGGVRLSAGDIYRSLGVTKEKHSNLHRANNPHSFPDDIRRKIIDMYFGGSINNYKKLVTPNREPITIQAIEKELMQKIALAKLEQDLLQKDQKIKELQKTLRKLNK